MTDIQADTAAAQALVEQAAQLLRQAHGLTPGAVPVTEIHRVKGIARALGNRLTRPLDVDAVEACEKPGHIQAIKRYREITSLGLREAKDAIDKHIATHGRPKHWPPTSAHWAPGPR